MSSESVTFPDRLEPASIDDLDHEPGQINRFLVILVEELNMPVMNALDYAKLLGGRSVAVHNLFSFSDRKEIEDHWQHHHIDIPLMILDSPNDSVLGPLREFIDGLLKRNESNIVTILLPVITGLKWWQRYLHNQTALMIERAFQNKAGVVIIRVPYSLDGDTHEYLSCRPNKTNL